MRLLKKFFWQFSREARFEKMRQEMELFLGQAHDIYDLERLEQEWDRLHGFEMRRVY